MSGAELGLVVSVFAACAVEAVEAATIVLAMGLTRGWRSALAGLAAGLAVLAVIVALLGPALDAIPLQTLRAVVGTLLLIFGLQWLRKAILRAAGILPLHDEEAIFERSERDALAVAAGSDAIDAYGFTIAFKGVVLEGLEVAFIALTFGSNAGDVGLAAAAAAAAVILVAGAATVAHRPLARVPENALKFGVGVMLTSFGVFWGVEGAGVAWPGDDAALAALIPLVLATSFVLVAMLRSRGPREVAPSTG
jgi:uncharacterized membrane protein